MSDFSNNLSALREKSGITRKELAENLGVTVQTYGAYENGKREPNLEKLCRIAAALHVSIDDLLGYKVDKFTYWKSIIECDDILIEKTGENVKVSSKGFTIDVVPLDYFVSVLEAIENDVDELLAPSRDMMIKTKIHEFVLDSILFDSTKVKSPNSDTQKSPTD